MLDLMVSRKYHEYQAFINGYRHPDFTHEITQKHHKIPRCVGGNDSKDNLILLTLTAHQKAHELLARVATPEYKDKLENAARQFTPQFKETYNQRPKKREDYGYFTRIGELKTLKHQYDSKPNDIFDALRKVSKKAFSLFVELKLSLDTVNNFTYWPTAHYSRSEKQAFYDQLSELINVHIVKKAKKFQHLKKVAPGTYMINPMMLMCDEYSHAKKIWRSLK